MQMRPAQALTAEEEGAEGSSKVTGLAESWISCLEKKKNVSWVSAAVLCSCERKCALFLKILQRVPESFKAHAGTMTFRDAPDFISVKDTDGDWLFKFTVAIGRMLLVSRHPLLVSSYYYHYSFSLLAFLYLGFFVVMEYFMRETVVGLGSLNNSAFWVCVYFGEISG